VAVTNAPPHLTPPNRIVYTLRALGKADLPPTFTLAGVPYRHERTIKHDFFAATGFYLSPTGERVVLKVGRTQEYGGIPLLWLGKWLCDRETRLLWLGDDGSFGKRAGDHDKQGRGDHSATQASG